MDLRLSQFYIVFKFPASDTALPSRNDGLGLMKACTVFVLVFSVPSGPNFLCSFIEMTLFKRTFKEEIQFEFNVEF